jgi:hypothetical protein
MVFAAEREDRGYRSRIAWLEDLCAGKRVIHLGCVDHGVDNLERKRRSGTWLHEYIAARATRCLGIDLESRGIEYMRDQLGYEDVLCGDATTCCREAVERGAPWDLLLIAEVLEHVDNPVGFLTSIGGMYRGYVKKIIVTVPNAFSWHTQRRARQNIERVNTDHRYWFTPYTICKVLVAAGFYPERVIMCPYQAGGLLTRLRAWKAVTTPLVRANIIAVADIETEPDVL